MEDPGHVMEEEADSTTSFLTKEVPRDLARLYYTVQQHGPEYRFDAELDAGRISSQLPPSQPRVLGPVLDPLRGAGKPSILRRAYPSISACAWLPALPSKRRWMKKVYWEL
ncbi:hypothetical protein FOCG_13900 [Fusarium oxysporum f. sp. radicis-lycopersici 26381]|uniref:Uncharacterized protein n=4 Tax=Fusarium oxysporum TaxID=5507 RepID=A0A420PVN2_FUSOX|nr:hypothetical protein FOZG_01514 [Fusarium oxysporum Fo47]EWZ91099.1 hypothetical protein FOWG_06817 [Fusarium oxysporum f. sp. lycopersici MN25]EXL43464.1 hypothetical protein FOCG_13900 [Fusarium oxysporum f. sp. radicis-lycopersici 26381]RKK30003.1 hypothetical protein BFJ65_g1910 [Fusarium oxysporum f. sp. cepae]RKK86848.1 hypothetical protein BFJ71_g13641 [Fusarium oxysporum]RYC88291.1 hypothetical protein BFJ63_vAg8851 [Fusarium oxysporum f. sp. narcissi]